MYGQGLSLEMLKVRIKEHVQHAHEAKLLAPFREEFAGLEEPHDVLEVLEHSEPYLPYHGSLGEMVLSVGKAIYMYEKGVDGIIDISPFTCMNGIICESIYPKVSRDCERYSHQDVLLRRQPDRSRERPRHFHGTCCELQP